MPGERLQLYTGQRTKACRKLVDPDPICIAFRPIYMFIGSEEILRIDIDDVEVEDIDRFADDDGFTDAAAMHNFFLKMYGRGSFVGSLINWIPVGAMQ